jgi:hypothetical protein
MKITCTTSKEVQGVKTDKTASVELPDNAFEKPKDATEEQITVTDFIKSVFDGLK